MYPTICLNLCQTICGNKNIMLPKITIAQKLTTKFLIVIFLCFGILLMHSEPVRAEGSLSNVSKKTDCFLVLGGSCDKEATTNTFSSETEIKPGANLSGKNLQGVNLHNADLRRSDLSGANLTGVDLNGAELSEVKISRIKNPGNLDFQGFDWSKIRLSKEDSLKIFTANLSKQDLVNFIKADPNGLDFSGLDWKKVKLSPKDVVSLVSLKLNQQDLINLIKSDSNQLNLSKEELLGLVQLNLNNSSLWRGSKLSSQDLLNLLPNSLSGVDLSGVDLQKANFTGSNLQQANLSGADLRKANLNGAKMPDGTLYRR
ncbi:pentapeptide repeat-containing protein [Microcoleus sp. CZ3-B4]|uniref:pentapeptide repeat-containing protein n=2 Tax=unclassified Microcoleus TaxID=2642155 RepID=UPI002FCF8776